jgi:hypothetical protein
VTTLLVCTTPPARQRALSMRLRLADELIGSGERFSAGGLSAMMGG